MRRCRRYLLASSGLATVAIISVSCQEWAKLSPFTAVKPQPDSAIVRFDNHEYALVSINDQSVSQLLSFCRRRYRDWWEKRFTEDLVEVLADMGHPMASDKTVKLVLKDSTGGRHVTIERAPMTAENRRAAYLFRQQSLRDHPDWPK